MNFQDFNRDLPSGANLEREVKILLESFTPCRMSDTLLCQVHHCQYGEWEIIQDSHNHWIVDVPADRSDERADTSIVRARREVEDTIPDPNLSLEYYVDPEWSKEEWEQYLQDRTNYQITHRYGQEVLEEVNIPTRHKDQVAWILSQHPETRASDRRLIQTWYELFGGWRHSGHGEEKTRYAIPKDYHWQTTTPVSLPAARRRYHQAGVWLPDGATREQRGKLQQKVRNAFGSGDTSPWEVLN